MNTYSKNDIRREKWIDVVRGIGIIIMLVNHTNVCFFARRIMSGFNMPLFFILSGYLFKDPYETTFAGFVKKKWKAYVIPYFVYCGINLLINMPVEYMSGLRGTDLLKKQAAHVFWIIYSRGQNKYLPNCGPLWFYLCLLIAEIYLWLILKYINNNMIIIVCMGLIAIQEILNHYGVIQLPWHIDTAMYGVVFMLIGYYIKREKILDRLNIAVCLSLLAIGIYAAITNTATIDMNNKAMGNPILGYLGGGICCA